MDMFEFSRLQKELSIKEFSDIVLANSAEHMKKVYANRKERDKYLVIESKTEDVNGTIITYRDKRIKKK
jgi:hypothetical protein